MSWGPNYPGKQRGTQRDANTPENALDALLKGNEVEVKWEEDEERMYSKQSEACFGMT